MGALKRKVMNLLKMFVKDDPSVIVSETRHFKKDFMLYVSKKTAKGTTELWAHSTQNLASVFLGTIRDGRYEKSPDFYHLPYRQQKYAELMSRIVVEGWTKPYNLSLRCPQEYR